MLKNFCVLLVVSVFAIFLQACSDGSDNLGGLQDNVLVFTDQEIPDYLLQRVIDESEQDPGLRLSGTILGKPITIVKLRGKTNHFGRDRDLEYIDYHATVPDTTVWIAEYPDTRELNLKTDETGWWEMYIVRIPVLTCTFPLFSRKKTG